MTSSYPIDVLGSILKYADIDLAQMVVSRQLKEASLKYGHLNLKKITKYTFTDQELITMLYNPNINKKDILGQVLRADSTKAVTEMLRRGLIRGEEEKIELIDQVVKNERLQILTSMLKNPYININVLYEAFRSALFYFKHQSIKILLSDSQIDPNSVEGIESNIGLSISLGYYKLVKVLLDDSRIKINNWEQMLINASTGNNLSMLEMILSRLPSNFDRQTNEPLFSAVSSCYNKVKYLVQKKIYKADQINQLISEIVHIHTWKTTITEQYINKLIKNINLLIANPEIRSNINLETLLRRTGGNERSIYIILNSLLDYKYLELEIRDYYDLNPYKDIKKWIEETYTYS